MLQNVNESMTQMSQEGTFINMYCKVLLLSIVFVVILKIIV